MTEITTSGADRILIVENSPVQAKIIGQHIEAGTRFSTLFRSSLAQLEETLEENSDDIFLAVCNLNLKDAPDGAAVDALLARRIPCVVLTSTFDDAIRNRYLEKNVVDYLDKSDLANMDGLIELIERMDQNRRSKVLLVDDNATVRAIMRKLLKNRNFTVLEAADGVEALERFQADPDVNLVVTDYEMPKMDGLGLIAELRKTCAKDRLSIIGVSAHGAGSLTARFLKSGANDFLKKPFEVEEFICRVTRNIAETERIQAIKEARCKDFLVDAANLQNFLEEGRARFASAPTLAGVRVRGLAGINAAHGWDMGDAVLRRTAALIGLASPDWELVCRSGDSFYALTAMAPDQAALRLDSVRSGAEAVEVRCGQAAAGFTVGYAVAPGKSSLDQALATVQSALSAS